MFNFRVTSVTSILQLCDTWLSNDSRGEQVSIYRIYLYYKSGLGLNLKSISRYLRLKFIWVNLTVQISPQNFVSRPKTSIFNPTAEISLILNQRSRFILKNTTFTRQLYVYLWGWRDGTAVRLEGWDVLRVSAPSSSPCITQSLSLSLSLSLCFGLTPPFLYISRHLLQNTSQSIWFWSTLGLQVCCCLFGFYHGFVVTLFCCLFGSVYDFYLGFGIWLEK